MKVLGESPYMVHVADAASFGLEVGHFRNSEVECRFVFLECLNKQQSFNDCMKRSGKTCTMEPTFESKATRGEDL